MGKGRESAIMRKMLNEATRCELCFATRHLEAHHIIPLVYGGPDVEENIIIICEACHVKLTPKNLLTQQGIRKAKQRNERIKMGIEQGEVKQIGNVKGTKLTTKKSISAKARIKELSKDFNGTMKDIDIIRALGLARNSYYKYKRELRGLA